MSLSTASKPTIEFHKDKDYVESWADSFLRRVREMQPAERSRREWRQVLERDMVVEIDHPRGKFKLAGNPIKTPGLGEGAFLPPPDLGEHTEEILRDLLGYSDEKIKELKAQKTVGRKEDENGK